MKYFIKTRFNTDIETAGESITAFFNGRQKTMSYDYALNAKENHKAVAQFFTDTTPWVFTGDVDITDRGYVFEVDLDVWQTQEAVK